MKGNYIMLSFNVRGDDVDITNEVRQTIGSQIEQINTELADGVSAVAHVNLVSYSNRLIKAEITIIFPFLLLRGEATTNAITTSISNAVDQIMGQIERYRTNVNQHAQRSNHSNLFRDKESPVVTLDVVRKKRIPLKQMDSETAILQMNLLNHDFYIYKDINDETINIIYRRNDGHYGLITTES
ncbi:ribosome hibernation promotion factor [Fructilactobacillus cliffordii]|uniref:HPF/RaiA family ribosome-associated protein n=1 Tax=Fructilactobacillus cliffordii TaxID=2940299 RepID=A0A9Q8ZNJ2_9LACO|nr:HPF/RaiA family ribosome-associated protein [Fructilactobacillus cliffordii]USS88690.1 HPF/RaiA family ribosome-associated protein [Fructilactobacillus cliffordii]